MAKVTRTWNNPVLWNPAEEMPVYLDVPFISQWDIVKGKVVKTDPTGCWYASACMVAYSYEAGPRLGVPQLWSMPVANADGTTHTGHWAMSLQWLDTFMKNENLRKLGSDLPKMSLLLAMELVRCGPLFVNWWKTNAAGQSYGHASVLIGVKGQDIILHDPENAPHTQMKLTDFYPKWEHMAGAQRQWWPVLRRNGADFSCPARAIA